MKNLFIKFTLFLLLLGSGNKLSSQVLNVIDYKKPNWIIGGNHSEDWSSELVKATFGKFTLELVDIETVVAKISSSTAQGNIVLHRTYIPRLYIGKLGNEIVIQAFITPRITTVYIMWKDVIITFFVPSNFK